MDAVRWLDATGDVYASADATNAAVFRLRFSVRGFR